MEENKMNFKCFFENFDTIMEASKITMGDYTEALFAIGLLQYALKKNVSEVDIFNLINEIPSLPYENIFNHDNYEVALHLQGKEGMANLFGGNFSKLPEDHQKQIKDIISKIATHIPKLKTIHKVDSFIAKAKGLEANKFIIVIKSTGSKTSQEGETKADVTMEVIPKENINIPHDIKSIRYSVKYSKDKPTAKVSESSLFNVILRLGNAFKLPLTRGLENLRALPYDVSGGATGGKWRNRYNGLLDTGKYKELSEIPNHILNFVLKIVSPELKFNDKNAIIQQFLLEFNNEMIVKEQKQPLFSTILYDFLEKEVFGQDLADVVKIDSVGIKDVDIEAYNKIRNSCLVEISTRPSKSENSILKFEGVAKDGSRFLLFWIENGPKATQIHIGEELLK